MLKRLALPLPRSRLLGPLLLALSLWARSAAAATFEVAPVLLEMQGAQRVTSMTITNREDHPTTIQVRPMLWQQAQGQDGLSTTSDVQVSPPIFTVGAGESQLVRIFVRAAPAPADVARERSYRLLIDEIPSPGQSSAVHMALRISIPLFVYAGPAGTPALEWKILADAKGPTWLSVANKGSRRAKLATVVVTDDSGRRHEVGGAKSAYVLPGAQVLWRLQTWNQQAQPIKSATVSGVADSGEINAQAPRVPLE
jgi:fimbrial chaperone protein